MDIVTTEEALADVVAAYSGVDAFVFDVETIGEQRAMPILNDVRWISLATYGRSDVIPMGHPHGEFIRFDRPLLAAGQRRVEKGLALRDQDYSADDKKATAIWTPAPEQLTPGEVFAALRPLMFSDQTKVGHNLKFDLKSVAKYYRGQVPSGPHFDTLVGAFLHDSSLRGQYGLADCLKRYLGYSMVKGVGADISKHSFTDVAKYSWLDSKYTWLLYRTLIRTLHRLGMGRLVDLEMDVLDVVAHMEMRGAKINVEALTSLHDVLVDDIEAAKGQVYRAAGRAFNMNSNAEKQRLLFGPKEEGGRGLRVKVLTEGGKKKSRNGLPVASTDASVSEEALRSYAGKDDLVDALLHYMDLQKLMSTYVIPYLGGDVERTTNGKTKTVAKSSLLIKGRVHGEFVQQGAETGRFSSKNPNLQNIPNAKKSERGKQIRNLFTCEADETLIAADYSQVEPRVIASLTGDAVMRKAFLEGEDIYLAIAEPLGVDRAAGKVLVLAMAYGIGPDKIAADLGINITAAKKLLSDFERKFKAIERYRAQVIREAKQRDGCYVETIMGRRRYLPDLRSKNYGFKSRAERQAFNTVIQGSAADIMKMAMVRAHRMIPEGSYLSMTVHDELVAVSPNSQVDRTIDAIREAMEGINVLDVPLIADIQAAKAWGDAK